MFDVSLSGSFFFFLLIRSPSSFVVKVKSCFLLCQCVYEGVYMTRLLVDDKTFKNIRCYSRWCFPLLVYVFSFFGRRILTFKYSSNAHARKNDRERRREFQCCYCCCCYFSCVMLLFSPWIRKRERKKNETESKNI